VLGELRGHGAIWGVPRARTEIYFEASGEIEPERMISHRFPFDRFTEAFEVSDDAEQSARVILEFER